MHGIMHENLKKSSLSFGLQGQPTRLNCSIQGVYGLCKTRRYSPSGSAGGGMVMTSTRYPAACSPLPGRAFTTARHPRVSNDNAHAEAFFRTAKYHPTMVPDGFDSLQNARQWAASFVQWYNHDHKHKALNFVTPHQKHTGEDVHLLAKRHQLYQHHRNKNPGRWIKGHTRDWTPVLSSVFNPPDIRTIEKNIKKSA
jgi:hypothetical protein